MVPSLQKTLRRKWGWVRGKWAQKSGHVVRSSGNFSKEEFWVKFRYLATKNGREPASQKWSGEESCLGASRIHKLGPSTGHDSGSAAKPVPLVGMPFKSQGMRRATRDRARSSVQWLHRKKSHRMQSLF